MKMIKYILAAIALVLLPTSQAMAGGTSTTYYYLTKLKVESNNSAMGKVYASSSNSAPSDSAYVDQMETNAKQFNSTSTSVDVEFYVWAQQNEGYKFLGWSTSKSATSGSMSASWKVTNNQKSTDSTYATTPVVSQTIYAIFAPVPKQNITFAANEGGTYTVNGGAPSSNPTNIYQEVELSLVATEDAEHGIIGWYFDDGTTRTYLSHNNKATYTIGTKDGTLGVDFYPLSGVAKVNTYAELVSALATAQAVEIPVGVTIDAQGGAVTVGDNQKLFVKGTLLDATTGAGDNYIVTGTLDRHGAKAKVGNQSYMSVQQAVDVWTSGTLTLLGNDTITSTIAITGDQTLDLSTYTLTANGCKAVEVRGGTLTVIADSKNPGGIKASSGCIYADYSTYKVKKTITVKGGVFDGPCTFNKTDNGASGERGTPLVLKLMGGTFKGKITAYRCYYFTLGDESTSGMSTFEDGVSFDVGYTSTCKGHLYAARFKSSSKLPTPSETNRAQFWYQEEAYNADKTKFFYYDADGYYVLTKQSLPANYAAIVGGYRYMSAQRAFDAASDGTITLNTNVVVSIGKTVANNAKLIIDASAVNANYTGDVKLNGANAKFVVKVTEGDEYKGTVTPYSSYKLNIERDDSVEGVTTFTFSNLTTPVTAEKAQAQVGETYYATLYQAFYEVDGTKGKTIVLLKDVTSCQLITSGRAVSIDGITDVTLDLNNHTFGISNVSTANDAHYKLTIIGNGVVDNTVSSLNRIGMKAYLAGTVDLSGKYELVAKGGTWKFNPDSFTYGGVTTDFVPDGYESVDNGNDTWTVREVPQEVTINVPPVTGMTVVVKVGDNVIVGNNGAYVVVPGSKVDVTYTVNAGYCGETITKTIASVEEGVTVTLDDDEQAKKAVAVIGSDKYYATLAEAIAAAANGETVTLLASCYGNGISINKSVTIDFGGFIYTMDGDPTGSTGTKTQAFQLLVGNDITLKNGTITSTTAKMLVQNYSNLTLSDITLDGLSLLDGDVRYTLSNNAGTTTIGAGTKIIAKEGGVAFDCYYWPSGSYKDGVSVTVEKGAIIDGAIEYAEDGTDFANFASKAVVTKDASVEIIAPDGYKWDDNGKLVTTVVADTGDDAENIVAVKQEQTSTVDETELNKLVDADETVSVAGKEVNVAEKVTSETKVEGVKLTVEEKTVETTGGEKTTGVQAVIDAAKAKAVEKEDTAFSDAIATTKAIEVKVEVKVEPTVVAVKTTEQSTTKRVSFKLEPEATVTVKTVETVGDSETVVEHKQVVPVTNDMIDKEEKIAVSFFTGFAPKTVFHYADNGEIIDVFKGDAIAYNVNTGVATVMIDHFSFVDAFDEDYVAQIGTTKYTTLAAAIAAVQPGQTIEIIADCSNQTKPDEWRFKTDVETGKVTLVEIPQAIINQMSDDDVKAEEEYIIVEFTNDVDNPTWVTDLLPEFGYTFEAQGGETDFDGWYVDFTVSADKDVAKNSMGLMGNYNVIEESFFMQGDLNLGFFAKNAISEGTKVPLLNYMTKKNNWTYEQIREIVKKFKCGAFNLSPENVGTTITVELRLFAPTMTPADIRDSSKWEEGLNTFVVATRSYKFLADKVLTIPDVTSATQDWPALTYGGIATAESPIPMDAYYLSEGEFVRVTDEPVAVTEPTAYFKMVPETKVPEMPTVDVKINDAEEQKDVDVKKPAVAEEYKQSVIDTVAELEANEAVPQADTGIRTINAEREVMGETKITNIVIKLTAIKIEDLVVEEVQSKTCTSATFDVKPVDEDGNKVDLAPEEEVTFRLPVSEKVTVATVQVYHENDFLGYYTVQGDDDKFVEITSSNFSLYKYVALKGAPNAVAAIGDTGYATLAEAFAAAEDGDTITLLKDCAGNGIVVPANTFATKGLTVDFAGFTYTVDGATVGSAGTETNGFQLNQGNKITFLGGSIVSTKAATLIQNYSDLTVDGMELSLENATGTTPGGNPNGQYVLSNNNGATKIVDTTLTAREGYYAFDACTFDSYTGTSVEISGDSVVSGKIEVSTYNTSAPTLAINGGDLTDATLVLGTNGAKATVTKDPSVTLAAPTGYVWKDNVLTAAVAKIGDTMYGSLADAIAAAKSGDTVTLLADIANAGTVSLPAGVTLDGNGKKLTGNSSVYVNAAGGTIKNTTFEDIHNDAGQLSAVYANSLSGTLTITGCTFDNCDWDAIQATPVAGATVAITGNTFDTDNTDGVTQQRYVHIQSAKNVDFTATVTGNIMKGATAQGTLETYYFTDAAKVDVSHNYIEDMSNVCILEKDGANVGEKVYPTYTGLTGEGKIDVTTLTTPVAVIKDTYTVKAYATLADALAAAKSGDTVTLCKDIANAGTVSLPAGVTLDGNGKKLTGNISVYVNAAGGTIKNTTFEDIHNDAGQLSAVYVNSLSGTLTITGCTFDNCDWDAIQATPVAGATMTITGNTFDTDNDDGVTQQRYVHIQSAKNVDFTATVTNNVMKGETAQGTLEAYYFTDASKVDVSHNYIEDMTNVCILEKDGANVGEKVYPTYTGLTPEGKIDETTLTTPVAVIKDTYTVKSYATLADALAAAKSGDTVTLCKDVALDAPISVAKKVTLDIGTFNVTPSTSFAGGDGLFFVNYGGDFTVDGTTGSIDSSANANIYEAIKMTVAGETFASARAKLTVNGGTIKGYYYGITGNGSRPGTDIVVNGGTITAAAEGDNLGIYNPQADSTVTINGGTLTGYLSAIEMRGGALTVTGGTLTATATEYAVAASGSGSTTKGAAVAIAQHTTKGDLVVTISGGTLSGVKCVSVANPQNNDSSNVSVTLGAASYTGALAYSADGNATVTNTGSSLAAPEGYKWDSTGKLVKKVYVAQIGETKYETVDAAMEVAAASESATTVKLIANSEDTTFVPTWFIKSDVTIDADSAMTAVFAPTKNAGDAPDTDGMAYLASYDANSVRTFTIGQNVTLKFPEAATKCGAMYLGYGMGGNWVPAKLVVNGRLETYIPYVGAGSTLTVNPSGSIMSTSEDLIVRWGSKVEINGTGAAWTLENPQADFSYVDLQGGTVVFTNTFVDANSWLNMYKRNSDKDAPVLELYNTTLKMNGNLMLKDAACSIKIADGSVIKAGGVQNAGTITVDMTGATDDSYTLIDAAAASTYGTYQFATGKDNGYTLKVVNNDLVAEKVKVAKIGDVTYPTLKAAADAAVSGQTIELLKAYEVGEVVEFKNGVSFNAGDYALTCAEGGSIKIVGNVKISGTNFSSDLIAGVVGTPITLTTDGLVAKGDHLLKIVDGSTVTFSGNGFNLDYDDDGDYMMIENAAEEKNSWDASGNLNHIGNKVIITNVTDAVNGFKAYALYTNANSTNDIVNAAYVKTEFINAYGGAFNVTNSNLNVDQNINVTGALNIEDGSANVSYVNVYAGLTGGGYNGGKFTAKNTTIDGADWRMNFGTTRDNAKYYEKGDDSSAVVTLINTTLKSSEINNTATIKMDATSKIVLTASGESSFAGVYNGANGVIEINATGLEGAVKVIDVTDSKAMTLADYGTVNVTEGYEAYVEGNDLYVKKSLTSYVQIGTVKYAQMADAVTSVTATPVDMSVVGSGNLGTKETTTGEGSEFTVAGTYNISGTEWANIGYLQLNPNKVTEGTRYVMNVGTTGTGANLVMTKPQLRRLSDLNITDSHVDFAVQPNGSKGYLFAFCDSTVNLKNSVVGYFDQNGGNSASVVVGQESTGSTDGMMATYISGTFTAEDSTVFTMTTDAKNNAFAIYDKGLATFKDSVLYSGYVTIGDHESGRSDRWTVGRDGEVATIELDNSKIIKNLADTYAFIVGDDKTGKLIMKNGSQVNFTDVNATVNANGSIEIDATSQIKCNAFSNAGTITVDMTGATDDSYTLIDAAAASTYGTYQFATGKDNGYTLKVVNNDLVAEKVKVAKIGDVTYPTLAAALKAAQSGDTIEVLDGTWGADAVGTLTTAEANVVRFKSLTIQPAEGATVTFTSKVSLGYDDSSTVNASMTVKNIAFDGASLAISNYNVVNVEGCTFANGTSDTAGTLIVQDACCKNRKSQGEYPASQITIKDCVIDGSNTGASGIRLRNSGNVSITGCTVKNSAFNGILFESNSSVNNTVAKTVTVTGNTITEWNATNAEGQGRAIRAALGTLASGSVVKIENNTFTKATLGLDTPDFIKMTEAEAATVSLEGNNWNNELSGNVSGNNKYYTVNGTTPAVSTTTSTKPAIAQVGTLKFDDLAKALNATAAGKTCELLSNVDLTDVEWTPISGFKGTFDGKGYTISGLTVSGAGYVGLFSSIDGGTVKDLTISGAKVTATGDKSGILAAEVASGAITNVKVVNSTISSGGEYVGGLFGIGYSAVSNCEITGCTISGSEQVGAAIGYMWVGSIENCTVTGNTVTATSRAGGLIGKVQFAGGNIGTDPNDKMWINGNTVSGTVNGGDMAGGIAGQIMGDDTRFEIKNNDIDVALTGTAKYPIGVLRDGQNATFTGALGANITGNWWEDQTLAAGSYQYTNVASGVDPQTIYRGVAMIGTTTYKTIALAVAAATSGDTIKVIADCTETGCISFPADKTLTLDLNGKTVAAVGDASGIWSRVYGNLTLTGTGYLGDTTHEKCGFLFIVHDAGVLTFEGDATFESGLEVAQLNADTTKVYVKAGYYIGDFWQDVCWTFNKLDSAKASLVEVTGGSFEDFDPSNAQTESPAEDWVKTGYIVTSETVGTHTVYTVEKDYVAQIGDVKYATLAEAVTAATAGQTVTLLKNCSGDGIQINKSITIDFGGFTYTMNGDPTGSTGTETQAFQLLAGNTIVFKNGAIVADNANAKMIIQNYANLTLNNMTLDATKGNNSVGYVLSTNNGTTEIINSTITAKQDNVAFDCCCWSPYTANTVTLTSGTINGDIEVSSYDNLKPTLNLNGGTISGKLVMGKDADKVTVIKDPSVTLAAPEGYKWDSTGKLVAIVLVSDCEDSNGTKSNVEIPVAWLTQVGVSKEDAADKTKKCANGLPAWQNYVLGMTDVSNDPAALTISMVVESSTTIATVDFYNIDLTTVLATATLKFNLKASDEVTGTYTLIGEDQATKVFENVQSGDQRFFKGVLKFYWVTK